MYLMLQINQIHMTDVTNNEKKIYQSVFCSLITDSERSGHRTFPPAKVWNV